MQKGILRLIVWEAIVRIKLLNMNLSYPILAFCFFILNSQPLLAQDCKTPNLAAGTVGATQSCDPLDFGYIISNYQSNDPQTVYEIDFGDDKTLTLNHADLNAGGIDTIFHNYQEVSCELPEKAYTFSIMAGANCATFPKRITISPVIIGKPPLPNINIPDTVCVNELATFRNLTVEGLNFECSEEAIYRWDFGDGTVIDTTGKVDVKHAFSQ
jgi:hypothetical protein